MTLSPLQPIEVPEAYQKHFSFIPRGKLLFIRGVLRLTSKQQKVQRVIVVDTDGLLLVFSVEGLQKRKLSIPREICQVYHDAMCIALCCYTEQDLAIEFHRTVDSSADGTIRRFLQCLTFFLPDTVPIAKSKRAFDEPINLSSKLKGVSPEIRDALRPMPAANADKGKRPGGFGVPDGRGEDGEAPDPDPDGQGKRVRRFSSFRNLNRGNSFGGARHASFLTGDDRNEPNDSGSLGDRKHDQQQQQQQQQQQYSGGSNNKSSPRHDGARTQYNPPQTDIAVVSPGSSNLSDSAHPPKHQAQQENARGSGEAWGASFPGTLGSAPSTQPHERTHDDSLAVETAAAWVDIELQNDTLEGEMKELTAVVESKEQELRVVTEKRRQEVTEAARSETVMKLLTLLVSTICRRQRMQRALEEEQRVCENYSWDNRGAQFSVYHHRTVWIASRQKELGLSKEYPLSVLEFI